MGSGTDFDVTRFVTAMLLLSAGVERAVEILKNIVDRTSVAVLHGVRKDTEATRQPTRSLSIQVTAVLLGAGIARVIGPQAFVGQGAPLDDWPALGYSLLLGLLAAGGSGFWSDILGLLSVLKQTREAVAASLHKEEAPRQQAVGEAADSELTGEELYARIRVTTRNPNPSPTPAIVENAVKQLTSGRNELSALVERDAAKFAAEHERESAIEGGTVTRSLRMLTDAAVTAVARVPTAERLSNWSGDVSYPVSRLAPWPTPKNELKSVKALIAMISTAEADALRVRAVGARHSGSEVLRTTKNTLVITPPPDGTASALVDVRAGLKQLSEGNDALVRVRGFAFVHQVAAELQQLRLALPNQGGFSAQTIAGALSCSTHGSGAGEGFGPLSDMVRAFDFVTAKGVTRVQDSRCPLTSAD
ncbi:MAG: FAD-binding protein, partial [Archangium sp.]|nr:FAD-binding protein [Archangium sp.]